MGMFCCGKPARRKNPKPKTQTHRNAKHAFPCREKTRQKMTLKENKREVPETEARGIHAVLVARSRSDEGAAFLYGVRFAGLPPNCTHFCCFPRRQPPNCAYFRCFPSRSFLTGQIVLTACSDCFFSCRSFLTGRYF